MERVELTRLGLSQRHGVGKAGLASRKGLGGNAMARPGQSRGSVWSGTARRVTLGRQVGASSGKTGLVAEDRCGPGGIEVARHGKSPWVGLAGIGRARCGLSRRLGAGRTDTGWLVAWVWSGSISDCRAGWARCGTASTGWDRH